MHAALELPEAGLLRCKTNALFPRDFLEHSLLHLLNITTIRPAIAFSIAMEYEREAAYHDYLVAHRGCGNGLAESLPTFSIRGKS